MKIEQVFHSQLLAVVTHAASFFCRMLLNCGHVSCQVCKRQDTNLMVHAFMYIHLRRIEHEFVIDVEL